MKCRVLIPCLLTLTLAACLGAEPAPVPNELLVATEGDYTYFRVRFDQPSPEQERDSRSFVPPSQIRVPLLFSTPVWDVPCYPTAERGPQEWMGPTFGYTFWGRAKRDAPEIALTLGRFGDKGAWEYLPVTLNLQKGSKFDPTSTATVDFEEEQRAARERIRARSGRESSDTSTTTTGSGSESSKTPRTAAEHFAMAQADWFGHLADSAHDPTGFYTFARMQTVRMARIPGAGTRSRWAEPWQSGRGREFAYDTFTGARAIQESLQLDRMLRTTETSEVPTIPIAEVGGVTTKAHPYDEMLKGREAKFSDLAKCIPADQYFLRFASVAKLQELADFSQQWGGSTMDSMDVGSKDSGLRERLQKQLCLPATLLSRMLGPTIIKEMAITGSDPFFREGTDVTVIFDLRAPDLFRAAVDQYWKAAQTESGAKTSTVDIAGTKAELAMAPYREVNAYRVFDGNLAIYSNSRAALERVLAVRRDAAQSVASAPDFKYMRATWPQDDAQEDGFLYLSDAFIRKLVGPGTRIAEKRRLEAYGAMRLLTNSVMLHGYLHGPGATPDEATLAKSGVLNPADLDVPGAGKITWEQAKAVAVSETYGTLRFMTPLCELPVDKITATERRDYEQFRDNYQNYWRRYFDPIGVKIRVDKTISFDVHIMPLINESAYNELKRLSGDKPASFDLGRVPSDSVVRFQVRLDPEAREVREARQFAGGMMGRDTGLTDWLGTWAAFWVGDSTLPPSFARDIGVGMTDMRDMDPEDLAEMQRGGSFTEFFDTPLALGVEVKNRFGLAAFLVALQGMVNTAAPNMVRFVPQDPYKGATFVKISPVPGGQIDQQLRRGDQRPGDAMTSDTATAAAVTTEPGLFYGNIGDAWYISTQRGVLERIVDAETTSDTKQTSRVIEYSGLLIASPGNMKKARPAVEKALKMVNRVSARQAMAEASLLYRCGLAKDAATLDAAAATYLGGAIPLQKGESLSYDPKSDQPVSTLWGPMRSMKKSREVDVPNPLTDLVFSLNTVRAWLRFTAEGLETHLEIERK
jgi:hypothetical protein